MTVVRLRLGWGEESLRGEEVEGGVRLASFSEFVALVPGDVVEVADGEVTALRDPRPVFVAEVYFRLATPESVVAEHAEVWARSTDVHKSSAITVLVVSESRRWLHDAIEISEEGPIASLHMLRDPDEPYDLRAALAEER